MAAKWQEGKLGDFLTLQRGFDLPARVRSPGLVPVVSSSGISDYHTTAPVKGAGVVTGRYGTIGEVFYLETDYWPLNTTLWVKDFKENHPRFVYYLLQTVDFESCSDKSGVPGVNRNDLHALPAAIPGIAEQRAIARVLGTLDDKIELNRRMNATLETLAKAIFRSWFVDFDPVTAKAAGRQPVGMTATTAALFPSSFEDSPLGPIPKGWQVDQLRNRACRVQYGFTTSATSQPTGTRFLRITDIQGGSIEWQTVPSCNLTPEDHSKYQIADGDIFIARTGASTGENVYVVDPPDAVFASYLVRINFPTPSLAKLVGDFLRTREYSDYVAGVLGGSAQPNANAQELTAVEFAFPPEPIAQAFFERFDPIDRGKAARVRQNATLAALRDALLPRLLSGELRLTDAERTVSEVV